MHPGFAFLSHKSLRHVASRIAVNKVVIDTKFDNAISIAIETDKINNKIVNEVNCAVNTIKDQTTNDTTVQNVTPLSTTEAELLEVLLPIFERNYEIIKKQSIEEKVYSTNCSKTLSDDTIKVIDFISINKLNEVIKPNFFDINVLLYTAAVTANEHMGDLKEKANQRPKTYNPPKWITNIENKINSLRKTIGQLTTVINCKKTERFTKHQKKLRENFRKKYGNTKQRTLDFKLTLLKQELKATCKKLKTHKKSHERKSINRRFFNNPKGVYRDFKGSNIRLEKIPTKNEVQSFWQNIWQRETKFNKSAKWLGILERTYCKNIIPTKYEIERKTLDKIISDMQLNKSPDRDLITSF